VLSAAAVVRLQAEERAEKEAQRQMEKDARNREREEAKKMARYPIEDAEVCPNCLSIILALLLAQSLWRLSQYMHPDTCILTPI